MNILFITADQWRGGCLSALDHPIVKTPNLDKLASDGVAFKQHYCQATPCGPSRASLYTGMYMQNHRALLNGTPLDARHTNVAKEVRKLGYKPALFGYTDVSHDPRQHDEGDYILGNSEGVLPGFIPVGHLNGKWKPWFAALKAKGYDIPENPIEIFEGQWDHPSAVGKGRTFAPAKFKAEDSSAAFLVDESIKYLSVRQDKHWFMHMSFLAPHPPFVAPTPFNAMYDAADMPLPTRKSTAEVEAQQHPYLRHYLYNQSGAAFAVGEDVQKNPLLSDDELRQIKATYYGMMSEVDSQIGRLIDYLKETGSYENTMIIFTSDHGEHMGDHWLFAKYGYFDQVFHIPLIIKDPRRTADAVRGSVVDAFTEGVDIMPTILNALDHKIPLQCDGVSLDSFLRGETPVDWRTEYHAEFDLRCPYSITDKPPLGLPVNKCIANIIRGERYKYVHFASLPPLLFDLQEDPEENHNLVDDPAYQGVVIEYMAKMLSWRMEHDDPGLTDMHIDEGGIVHNVRSM